MAIEKLAMRDNEARYPNQRAVKITLDASHIEAAKNKRYINLVWDLNTAVMKDLNRYAPYVLWQYFCHIGDKNYKDKPWYPSQKQFEDETGIGKKGYYNAMDYLIEKGYLRPTGVNADEYEFSASAFGRIKY